MEMFDRQIRVFGKAGQRALQKLIVGIVGAGGIGSLIFMLLVRLGVIQIIIIDDDDVEKSNLNRLAGSTLSDAQNKTPKVLMLERRAKEINRHIEVIPVQKSILEEDAQQQLKMCDVFFGCTDNQSSRWEQNRISAEYLIPYFDTGTGIKADADLNIEHAGGQVRVVIPGMGCLNCINGIDMSIAQQEKLPEPERQVAIKLGYIDGADIHAPAVASLNGVIANLAVTEFMAFATGFKPLNRYIFYDFLNALVVPLAFDKNPRCFTCSHLGSLAIGDKGKHLPTEMLINELKPQTHTNGAQNANRKNKPETVNSKIINHSRTKRTGYRR
ncbi:ThiF family adenylyltransferase [Planctomycetota bacterium]